MEPSMFTAGQVGDKDILLVTKSASGIYNKLWKRTVNKYNNVAKKP